MTDNVDIFKKIVFTIPSTKRIAVLLPIISTVYATITILAFNIFTQFSEGISSVFLLSIMVFILPSVLSAETLAKFIPDYPKNWGYFLAAVNITLLFIYGLILSGANNFTNGWSIFWLSLATVYISNLLVLLLTLGQKHITKITLLSLIQPLTVLLAFHIFLGSQLNVTTSDYVSGFAVVAVAGLLVFLTVLVAEYLMSANLKQASVLQLTAGLLQKRQEALDLGYPTNPDVQTLQVKNEEKETNLAIPWIHPGPLEGFGGGKITSDIIQELNQKNEGFFLHVPSTHKSDPTDPEDYQKIIEAMEKPEKNHKSSKLIERKYGDVKFFGRKIGGQKIVFMDADELGIHDDFEISIFREAINLNEVTIIDLHSHDKDQKQRKELWYNTEKAEKLRRDLKKFLKELENQPLSNYKAGFSTDIDGKPVFSIVEQVEDQKTLLFGIEGNGISQKLQNLRQQYRDEYDNVLVFSTDTHQSIHQLSSKKEQANPERVKNTVRKAEQNLSKASIGLTNTKAARMKLLQEDYSGLIFSINILIRLIILLLAAVYTLLVIWVFF